MSNMFFAPGTIVAAGQLATFNKNRVRYGIATNPSSFTGGAGLTALPSALGGMAAQNSNISQPFLAIFEA